jgi:hypothetical protein
MAGRQRYLAPRTITEEYLQCLMDLSGEAQRREREDLSGGVLAIHTVLVPG